MKLTDIFYRFRTSVYNAVRLSRYNPFTASGRQAILSQAKRIAVHKAQRIDVSGLTKKSPQAQQDFPHPSPPPAGAQAPQNVYSPPIEQPNLISVAPAHHLSPYPEYKCRTNDPLGCHYPYHTVQQAPQAKFCSGCGFMVPLTENQEIRGRRGIYKVTRVGINQSNRIIRNRGMGRLYEGIRKNDNQPIIIKEFLLPNRCFKSLEDVQHRQGTFVSVANLASADGRERDFRLLIPWEAIADESERRCYLITSGNLDALPTLKTYLLEQGPMDPEQVRILIDQILQTLEFVHGQRFQMSSGQIQEGLVHGNLSLESALIYGDKYNFFIYLTDLLLWEYLFYHPNKVIETKTIADDLKATGEVGFSLLAGLSPTVDMLDPRNEQNWTDVDIYLKNFILQLLGLESPFSTAIEAREVLRKLPQPQVHPPQPLIIDEDKEINKKTRWWLWLITPVILIGFFGLRWLVIKMISLEGNHVAAGDICCELDSIKEVNVPTGEFFYTAEEQGTTAYILTKSSLLETQRSLVDELQVIKPGLVLEYTPARDEATAINKVAQEMVSFAMVSQIKPSTSDTIISKTVAYDGLLIIVPFTVARRSESLSKALRGKITFEQVQDIYTGKITNWQELGGADMPIKLYIPADSFAVEVFERKVLKDDTKIALFRKLIERGVIETETTQKILELLQPYFEDSDIGITSFGFASKIFNQCSAYPLALVESENFWLALVKKILFIDLDKGVAPYVNIRDGKPIDAELQLCTNKGNYRLAEGQFQNQEYPLSVSVVVLYTRSNQDDPKYKIGEKFAEMLTTNEGQKLLKQTNLVPLPTSQNPSY